MGMGDFLSFNNMKRKLKNKIVNVVLYKFLYRNNNGIYILNENWDHLIILDDCRYDVFSEEIKTGK